MSAEKNEFFITPSQAREKFETALEKYGEDINQAIKEIEESKRALSDLERIFLTEKIEEIQEMIIKPYDLNEGKRTFLKNLKERIENLLKSSKQN